MNLEDNVEGAKQEPAQSESAQGQTEDFQGQ